MGLNLVSLRGDGPWRGRSTVGVVDRGRRMMRRILNGYVAGDGHEIRSFPGFRTLVDLTADNNDNGYRRLVYDAVRPVLETAGSPAYYLHRGSTTASVMHTLKCKADELHVHGFEQVRDTLVLFGESGHRKIPLYDTNRATVTVTSVEVVSSGGNDVWRVGLSANPGFFSANDSSTGMHAAEGSVVWIENVTLTQAGNITQAQVDATLNNRFHKPAIGVSNLTILTTIPGIGTSGSSQTCTGDIYRTRNNASDVYPSPGLTPWHPTEHLRIDDPPALTTWTVREPLDIDTPASRKCQPAWVANRQRDFDDGVDASPIEGAVIPSASATVRGMSRRQQRALPYRLNPEVAGDRIIFAAPGYLCLFQAPLMVPIEPEDWPSTPSTWSDTSGRGLLWFGNDVYDKPRCLGVPKGMMIDSTYEEPRQVVTPTSPWNFVAITNVSGTQVFPAGTYKLAITYVDDATGEEGLSSEVVEVTIPASGSFANATGLMLTYMHPGYFFPESLPNRINVYLAPPGEDALGFYTSISLRDNTGFTTGRESLSAKYGAHAGGSPRDPIAAALHRMFILSRTVSPTDDAIDFTRLAPQHGQMPRGAEAARMIRGRLLTVGHSGTHGNASELQRLLLSNIYASSQGISPKVWTATDQLLVRGFRESVIQASPPYSPDNVNALDGPCGIGGRYFPPAYQGLEIIAPDLMRHPYTRAVIDRCLNFETFGYATPAARHSPGFPMIGTVGGISSRDVGHTQRLQVLHSIRDVDDVVAEARYSKEAFLVLPRGQIQVGDPGRPGAVSLNAIQFMDGKKDDDGIAIGEIGGSAIICSKKETFGLSWVRDPKGSVPEPISTEFGCIATNSMVRFDGGLAWISERGPVAFAGEFAHVGSEIEDDFHGEDRRYALDSKGLMRHCWGVYDQHRGIVMWGLVTTDSTHEIEYEGVSVTFDEADDEAKSRFPCNEILCWNPRANAFSWWQPPSGLEVKWMRPLKQSDGSVRMAALTADNRIVALDDAWQDTNGYGFASTASNAGTDGTLLTVEDAWAVDGDGGATARGSAGNLLRAGMAVTVLRDGKILGEPTTIASLDKTNQQVALTDDSTWRKGDTIEIGNRPVLVVETAFCGEALTTTQVQGIHLRYQLVGQGGAHVDCAITTSDLADASPREIGFTEDPTFEPLAKSTDTSAFHRIGQRRVFGRGGATGPEVSVKLTVTGRAAVRLCDVLLEVP